MLHARINRYMRTTYVQCHKISPQIEATHDLPSEDWGPRMHVVRTHLRQQYWAYSWFIEGTSSGCRQEAGSVGTRGGKEAKILRCADICPLSTHFSTPDRNRREVQAQSPAKTNRWMQGPSGVEVGSFPAALASVCITLRPRTVSTTARTP